MHPKRGKSPCLERLERLKVAHMMMQFMYLSPNATVYSLACPEFVPIVESGQYKSENAGVIVERTLA